MLDAWDGFWFRAGQWAFEVGLAVVVLTFFAIVILVGEWWQRRSKGKGHHDEQNGQEA